MKKVGLLLCLAFIGVGALYVCYGRDKAVKTSTQSATGIAFSTNLIESIKNSNQRFVKMDKDETLFFQKVVKRNLTSSEEADFTEKVAEESKNVHALFIIGNALNLSKPYSYKTMKKELAQEEKNRKKKQAQGEVVYGPTTFSETSFLAYQVSTLSLKIENQFLKQYTKDFTEKGREYYEENLKNFETLEQVEYAYTLNEETKVQTADETTLSALQKTDAQLGEFLASHEKGETITYETLSGKVSVEILKVQKTQCTFEEVKTSAIKMYVHTRYFPELVRKVMQTLIIKGEHSQ